MTPTDFLPQAETIACNIRASLSKGSYAHEAALEIAEAMHGAYLKGREDFSQELSAILSERTTDDHA